ncbi:MAG: hypothetical protein ACXWQO_12665 [Bdellovibrionota bacterium]
MSIADQALFLLDIPPSTSRRKKLENFFDLEQTIRASLRAAFGDAEPAAVKAEAPPAPYSVASRMGRANYEDQARAEALMSALQKLRASHQSRMGNGRVIREP